MEHFADDKHYFELPGYIALPSSDVPFGFEERHFQQAWQGFCSVWNSSWWTRLWCVQEALLSREALVMLGRWSIGWEKFNIALQNTHRHQLSCCADAATLMASRFVFRRDNLVMDRQLQAKSDEKVGQSNLDSMLRRYRHKKCQDPRDKVFGLLGLIKMHKSQKLLPDYSLPLNDVLINAMEAVIVESDGDLGFLTGSGFNSHRQSVPSWVRDFASELDPDAVLPECQRVDAYTLYNASTGVVSTAIQRDRTELVLKGLFVDRVREIGEPIRGRDVDHINQILKSWHNIAGLDCHSRVSFSSNVSQEVFWRTMIGDAMVDPQNTWKRLGSSELKAFEQWACTFPFSAAPGPQSPLDRTFLFAMRAAICGRAIFVTQFGHTGLCEPTTRAGDEVWILHGGRVPFLLRPITLKVLNGPPQYVFIGDCHITRFMDGEAFQQVNHMAHEVVLV